ncbi:MAG TPA: TetR/AcrR family transcriptional regulator [Terriglobia bacterium]|nr:TetR/AcrR family transcriptional regulator [Terriglobia bacterium]
MSSRLGTAPRRIPQQPRGERRVASLLRAAAAVLADTGYAAATMSAIAERSNSSIGSLYQFFPSKEAVVEALRAGYVKELERLWESLAADSGSLTVEELVSRLIQSQVEFAEEHAGFLALFEAPPTVNSPRRREIIRGRIARVVLKRNPDLPKSEALRTAAVTQQIVRALLTLYARADRAERGAILEEFAALLTGYLAPKLGGQKRGIRCKAAGSPKESKKHGAVA